MEREMPAAEPTVEELKAQLEATRRDMRILARMVRRRAGARALEARDEVVRGLDELSGEARARLGAARSQGTQLAEAADEAVRRNPLVALAVALALGWLIGKLTRR
jgi:ElaB/YqjD/DUF883 family membrane-anchored ribosome-binding protein